MVVQLKGLWLYDYRVYGCTTIRVVVVRLKGVVTRLGRPADCSRQSCWLGSAGLLSLVAIFEKQSPSTREAVSLNSRSSLLKLKETFPWTQRNVSFCLFNHILSLIQTSEYAYSIIIFCLFKHLNSPAELSPSSGRTGSFIALTFLAGDKDAASGWSLIYLLAIEIIDNLFLILLMKSRRGDGSRAGNNGETDGFFRQKFLLFCSFLL